MIYHSSHDPFCREPAGPQPAGSEVLFRLMTDEADDVILRAWMGEELAYPMKRVRGDQWEVSVSLPNRTGIYWYDFILYRSELQLIDAVILGIIAIQRKDNFSSVLPCHFIIDSSGKKFSAWTVSGMLRSSRIMENWPSVT